HRAPSLAAVLTVAESEAAGTGNLSGAIPTRALSALHGRQNTATQLIVLLFTMATGATIDSRFFSS
ncbi:MAG: hypothetical protein AABY75_06310, partial [Bacteroidota bacterium]